MIVDHGAVEFSPPELFADGVWQKECEWDSYPSGEYVIAHQQPPEPRMIVGQNWFDELERLVPTQ